MIEESGAWDTQPVPNLELGANHSLPVTGCSLLDEILAPNALRSRQRSG